MGYRLHIDIPLDGDEETAIKIASEYIRWFITDDECVSRFKRIVPHVEEINVRLGHDDDRQKSNYLLKNANGHVNNKKMKIKIS